MAKSHRLIFHLKSRIFVRFLSSTDISFRSFALNLAKELIELNRRSGIFGTNVVWWYAKYAYYRNNQCHVMYCRDGHRAWRNTSMRFCPHYHKLKIPSKKIFRGNTHHKIASVLGSSGEEEELLSVTKEDCQGISTSSSSCC